MSNALMSGRTGRAIMQTRFIVLAVFAVLLLGKTSTTSAEQITYSVTFEASGKLDGYLFNAPVTITGIGDPTGIQVNGSYRILDLESAQVSVAGLFTDTITDSMQIFSITGLGLVAFFNQTIQGSYPPVVSSALDTYALTAPFGPIVNTGDDSYTGFSTNTSGGTFVFNSGTVTPGQSSFYSFVTPVPEPASLALVTVGLALLAVASRRSRQVATA